MAHLPAARAPRQPRIRGLNPIANACLLLLVSSTAAQAQEPQPQTLDTVVITGIRKGVEDAIATKRNNTSIVEAVSAEDIGKLPDVTVAESLGRISGVAVQRSKVNGKAAGVSVRGMAPAFGGSPATRAAPSSTSSPPSC
jgi:iron complex outermembrane receptor protein